MYNLMKMARVGLLVAAVVSAVTPSSLAQSREGSSLWDSVKTSQDADDYKAYLDKYPDGTYAPLAKRRISALESHGTNATTLPPAAGPNSPGHDDRMRRNGQLRYMDVLRNARQWSMALW